MAHCRRRSRSRGDGYLGRTVNPPRSHLVARVAPDPKQTSPLEASACETLSQRSLDDGQPFKAIPKRTALLWSVSLTFLNYPV
jgi:hypothetical protein